MKGTMWQYNLSGVKITRMMTTTSIQNIYPFHLNNTFQMCSQENHKHEKVQSLSQPQNVNVHSNIN